MERRRRAKTALSLRNPIIRIVIVLADRIRRVRAHRRMHRHRQIKNSKRNHRHRFPNRLRPPIRIQAMAWEEVVAVAVLVVAVAAEVAVA